MAYKTQLKLAILLITLFIYPYTVSAQQLTGRIRNGTGVKSINFKYSQGLVSKEDSAIVNNNGAFIKNFAFKEAKYILITYSSFRKRIYVFPGGNFKISFDVKDDSTFQKSFTVENDYHINRYLDLITKNQVHYKFISNSVKIKQPIDSFTQVLKDFRSFSDSLRRAFFTDVQRGKQVRSLTDFLITDSINWYSYSILAANDYVSIIKTGNKELFRKQEIENRLVFQAYDTYFASEYYNRLWFFFLKGEFEAQLKKPDSTKVEKMGFDEFALQYIQAKNIQGRLKELIVSQLLNEILEMYSYRTVEQNKSDDTLILSLKQMISERAFIAAFDRRYYDQKRILFSHQIGKRAPDFSLSDTAGKIYTLNDFTGRILLVDVWASWCGPCTEEFPYLHQLEDKLRSNKNFQLLSVSIDDSKQLWLKNGILKFNPPGLGLWEGKEKLFSRDYNINQIPMLILLDDTGKFIDFNPPRASEGDLLYKLILQRLDDVKRL